MKRFRFRIASLLWLVAIAAAFLAGTRYGEYRAAGRGKLAVYRVRRVNSMKLSTRPMAGRVSVPVNASWQVSVPDQL
jgi:hypothetical protein